MNHLLLEIGTEEIPAGYIEPALKSLSSNLLSQLIDSRISCGKVKTFGTPKRLAVEIKDVANKQNSLTQEIIGPPETVGYDDNGNLTMAGKKFAEKLGVKNISSIKVKDTGKGKYLCVNKTKERAETIKVLEKILPKVIVATSFPKTMRWSDLRVSFARPIQSIMALFGNKIIPFTIGNIKSDNVVYGHRFMKPHKINISTPDSYVEVLRDAYVIVDINERKGRIKKEIVKTADSIGGKILPDEALVDIVKNLVEYTAVIAGNFDNEFLELPDEILITAMREHQKYFGVIDESGNLLSNFIVVNNTLAKDMDLVRKGHEKVIRARLADAKFFYHADLKNSFDFWLERLHGILFQAELGTMLEKTERIEKLTEFISEQIDNHSDFKEMAKRAAKLCKTDLVTFVVDEFPKLQGVMGRIYAQKKNEPETVALAIEEHYRPIYSGGELPQTATGAIIAIADKIDTICGCFSIGQIPTGGSDPYALRRQCIGIIQIIRNRNFSFSLKALIKKSVRLYKKHNCEDDLVDKIYHFIKARMEYILAENNFSKDVILSVTGISVDVIPDVWNKVNALEKFKTATDFEPLAVAFKRVVNIIKKADISYDVKVNEKIFEHACEKSLFDAYKEVNYKVSSLINNNNFF